MSKIKIADFYYGAVLSLLFSKNITPAIVENDINRQVYDITTNSKDCRLFIKYRTSRQKVKKANYSSWLFTFTEYDKMEIKEYIEQGFNLLVTLVCGVEGLADSEIAVLNKNEITKIMGQDKSSITISREKYERAFRVAMGGGRANSLKIKTNRFEELFWYREE